jgi:hypothetical protein
LYVHEGARGSLYHVVVALTSLTQGQIFLLESVHLNRMIDDGENPFDGEWFFQKVEGSAFRRPHRSVDGTVSGDDHNRNLLVSLLDLLQYFHPSHFGKPEIEQHDIDRVHIDDIQASFPILSRENRIPVILEHILQCLPDVLLVIDYKYGSHAR